MGVAQLATSSSSTLILLRFSLLFSVTLVLIPTATSTPTYLYSFCQNTTTFARNSPYGTNLASVLRSLSLSSSSDPSAARSGFFATSSNTTTNTVYGLFLCRGDQNATSCSDCVRTATMTDLPNKYCPNGKVAVVWYDECMVRYSNQSLLGIVAQGGTDTIYLTNTQKINGNETKFSDLLGSTLPALAAQAAAGDSSGRKFATKVAPFTSLNTLYALGQCTPDLSTADCDRCLITLNGQLPIAQGARILTPSCNVRYETYPFFNGAANLSLPGAPPPAGRGSNPTPTAASHGGKNKVSAKVIAAIVVPVTAIAMALLVVGICLIKKRAKKYDSVAVESVGEDFTTVESLQYDLGTLQAATNIFSDENKLGEGGFGGVYKGKLSSGQEVAVKRLSRSSGQGAQEFKTEVLLVAKLQHRNLARLLGFCLAGEEKLLVYEYVPNKSLDSFLFDREKRGQLDWGRRYKIIGGIARGMLYLHQDSRLRIIHRDLKASNVLLDADMTPKISDFGMARIFGGDQTQGNTSKVVGTYGYLSPEYAMHGQFSVKSDVYSFGVLVLEIISGKKNSTFYESGYAEDLLSYAWKKWREGTPLEFVDPAIRESYSSNEVMRCLHLGLFCVQESIDERPTMATAVLMLDSHSVTLPMPEQPAFFIKTSKAVSDFPKEISSDDQSASKSVHWSINDASITEMEPR